MRIKMDISKSLHQYFEELSSNSPTPGGGNVAALSGALASSLGIMVCNLTIGKKKYIEVEAEMTALKNELAVYQKRFIELGEKDNAAFDQVMDAFKLPKTTEEEIEKRNKAIEDATIGATEPPMEVILVANELLKKLGAIIEKGNQNSLSDAGVAASIAGSAAKGAYLNVLINCSSLSNQIIAQEIKKRADIIVEEAENQCNYLVNKVISSFQK